MTVRDTMNNKNIHKIKVEVTQLHQLVWLEDHIEIRRGKTDDMAILNVIALDIKGRKFTNCTSVNALFELKGEGILQGVQTSNSYDDLRAYVLQNRELMLLKNLFDENPQAMTVADLKSSQTVVSKEKERLLLHNNFGICSQ